MATQYSDWVRALTQCSESDWHSTIPNRDLRLLLKIWNLSPSQELYLCLQIGGAALVAILCLAVRLRGLPERRLLTFVLAIACCWMVLLGPGIESCTYILLTPSLAWTLISSFIDSDHPSVRWMLLSSYGILLVCLVASWFPNGTSTVHGFGLHPVAALLALSALLLQEYRRTARSRSGDEPGDISPLARAA